jgi:hypothetical protein
MPGLLKKIKISKEELMILKKEFYFTKEGIKMLNYFIVFFKGKAKIMSNGFNNKNYAITFAKAVIEKRKYFDSYSLIAAKNKKDAEQIFLNQEKAVISNAR